MMWGRGVLWLLAVGVLLLTTAALVKYLLSGRPSRDGRYASVAARGEASWRRPLPIVLPVLASSDTIEGLDPLLGRLR